MRDRLASVFRMWLLCLVIGFATYGHQVGCFGASVTWTPQIDLPEYWKNHAISLVTVGDGANEQRIPIVLVEQYSGEDSWRPPTNLSPPNTHFLPQDDLQGRQQFPPLGVGERLLVVHGINRAYQMEQMYTVAVKFPNMQTETQIVGACRVISKIRGLADVWQALSQAKDAKDTLAERFALRQCMSSDLGVFAQSMERQVLDLRDNASTDVEVRILCSEVIEQNRVYRQRADDWNWLTELLRTTRDFKQDDYAKIITRLIRGHPERHKQTVDLLVELAGDGKRPTDLRLAIVRAASDSQVFNGEKSDSPENLKVMDMLEGRLQDLEGVVRHEAAKSLWIDLGFLFTMRPIPPAIGELSQRVIKAMESQIEKETDDKVKAFMKSSLSAMRDIVAGRGVGAVGASG
jgi:hypothetical protein